MVTPNAMSGFCVDVHVPDGELPAPTAVNVAPFAFSASRINNVWVVPAAQGEERRGGGQLLLLDCTSS